MRIGIWKKRNFGQNSSVTWDLSKVVYGGNDVLLNMMQTRCRMTGRYDRTKVESVSSE